MSAFGCFVKFTAQPGQRDALIKHLLYVATEVPKVATGCDLYLINTSPTEPESVWITEVWKSQEEHDASVNVEVAQETLKHIIPLLAGAPEKIDVLPVGGKGLAQV